MSKEFADVMKEFNKKSMNDKLFHLTNIIEKAIKYFSYRIEELENELRLAQIRFMVDEKKALVPPILNKPKPTNPIDFKRELMNELKGKFKKMGVS